MHLKRKRPMARERGPSVPILLVASILIMLLKLTVIALSKSHF